MCLVPGSHQLPLEPSWPSVRHSPESQVRVQGYYPAAEAEPSSSPPLASASVVVVDDAESWERGEEDDVAESWVKREEEERAEREGEGNATDEAIVGVANSVRWHFRDR